MNTPEVNTCGTDRQQITNLDKIRHNTMHMIALGDLGAVDGES